MAEGDDIGNAESCWLLLCTYTSASLGRAAAPVVCFNVSICKRGGIGPPPNPLIRGLNQIAKQGSKGGGIGPIRY